MPFGRRVQEVSPAYAWEQADDVGSSCDAAGR